MITIPNDWKQVLKDECAKPYFKQLEKTIEVTYNDKLIYPPQRELMTAFKLCPFAAVRVVILGQDPYHQTGQAHGLAFSVPTGVRIPPSLRNIYKELATDILQPVRTDGNLVSWATQGVLLLNTTLTVLPGAPGSHQKIGWETFTDAVIKNISTTKEHVVFILWGNFAKTKIPLIAQDKHLILTAPHPSPLSAYTGFFGSKPFSQANRYLQKHGLTEIAW